MASDTDKRLAKLRDELAGWHRRGVAASDALDGLPADADESEMIDARGWLTHCEQKQAAIARMIAELENGVARLDDYRKR